MRIARTMQILGYALYGIAALEPVLDSGHPPWAWVAVFAVFGLALHVGASVPSEPPYRRRRFVALSIMTPAMLVMAALRPCTFGALMLVVVASQAALILTPRAASAWVLAQTLMVSWCLIPSFGWVSGIAEIITVLGFQGFAVAAIASARSESEARVALAHTHAELLATRSLLDEATRVRERTRIARDLHDVLGHNLTALGLQLEIASHVGQDAARAQVTKARELTSRLLDDVRDVVASMRTLHPPTLVAAIRALVVEVPGLAIHLDVPEALVVEDSCRAECVVRCVQEIVTNTRRHARGAENLWIRLRREGEEITVEAHDDGKGEAVHHEPHGEGHGHGLHGMRSRLEEMGGWLEIKTAPERTFAISARLPVRGLAGAEA